MVPAEALVNQAGKAAGAWVVSADGMHAELRELSLGLLQRENYIAVDSGILPGDLVILPPHAGLHGGRRIAPSIRNAPQAPSS